MAASQGRRQTIEQERGRVAWADVKQIKDRNNKKLEQEYRSIARGLNSMIQINGLGQTLGFLKAKGKDDEKKPHYLLLMHLSDWMQNENHFKAPNREVIGKGYDGLLTWVTHEGTTSADYRRATTECLAFGTWLGRFAEAELQEAETEEGATSV
jgi:CRISPR-associated protein Cmr5